MSLPQTMRAIAPPQKDAALTLTEIAIPQPGAGQVLIRVRAAGVNRPDLVQRQGKYPAPPGASPILGLEVAGDVAAIGEGVTRWRAGDAVCALLSGGGYAEYAIAHEGSVLPKPAAIDYAEAACLPETIFTVWANVFESGALKAGERLLVHGGSSGIGTTAIQMAKAMGADVFATAGTPEKVALCESLGAKGINYRTEDFGKILKDAGGADVILDMVGAPYLTPNLDCLKQGGRLVYIAFLQGSKMEADLMRVMLKRLTITGSTLRIRPDAEKARIAEAVENNVWPLIQSGAIKPIVTARYKLAEAEKALQLLESGAHSGKIALLID
ncbi:MAG: NAD(P)H-quinone oxidoreductase [Caulobacterales bacterium]